MIPFKKLKHMSRLTDKQWSNHRLVHLLLGIFSNGLRQNWLKLSLWFLQKSPFFLYAKCFLLTERLYPIGLQKTLEAPDTSPQLEAIFPIITTFSKMLKNVGIAVPKATQTRLYMYGSVQARQVIERLQVLPNPYISFHFFNCAMLFPFIS